MPFDLTAGCPMRRAVLQTRHSSAPDAAVVHEPTSLVALQPSADANRLYVAVSTIPGADLGLFARYGFRPNAFICAYHGVHLTALRCSSTRDATPSTYCAWGFARRFSMSTPLQCRQLRGGTSTAPYSSTTPTWRSRPPAPFGRSPPLPHTTSCWRCTEMNTEPPGTQRPLRTPRGRALCSSPTAPRS